jgi:hypothetical protein
MGGDEVILRDVVYRVCVRNGSVLTYERPDEIYPHPKTIPLSAWRSMMAEATVKKVAPREVEKGNAHV